jgi:hypothetical protein
MSSIYISSTYEDLQEHRRAVSEVVRRLQHEPIGMEDYHAADERPLDRCLRDVRRCQAYIGILAWRYGFVPRGETLSITTLEYEEAGRRSIPRLLFLADDASWPKALRDPDPTKITAFREHVREAHVVDFFHNKDNLQLKVSIALAKQLGDGIRVPPLLPYRCNRDAQYEDLEQAVDLVRTHPDAGTRLLVVLAHGGEQQAVNKFVECVRSELPRLIRCAPEIAPVWREVSWPTDKTMSGIEAALFRNMAKQLPAREATADLAARLGATDAPVMLHSRVFTDRWTPVTELALRSIILSCTRLRLPHRAFPAVLLLTVDYRTSRNWFSKFHIGSRNQSIRQALQAVARDCADDPYVVLTRELEDVTRHHAETWGDSEAVQTVVQGADIRPHIDEVFRSDDELPMRPLAVQLRDILRRSILEQTHDG